MLKCDCILQLIIYIFNIYEEIIERYYILSIYTCIASSYWTWEDPVWDSLNLKSYRIWFSE